MYTLLMKYALIAYMHYNTAYYMIDYIKPKLKYFNTYILNDILII
jgi:hypothetical protein